MEVAYCVSCDSCASCVVWRHIHTLTGLGYFDQLGLSECVPHLNVHTCDARMHRVCARAYVVCVCVCVGGWGRGGGVGGGGEGA